MIFGLLLAYVVAPVVAYFLIDSAAVHDFNAVEQFSARAAEVRQIAQITSAITIMGLGEALVSALYSFGVFVIWFIGPPEKK